MRPSRGDQHASARLAAVFLATWLAAACGIPSESVPPTAGASGGTSPLGTDVAVAPTAAATSAPTTSATPVPTPSPAPTPSPTPVPRTPFGFRQKGLSHEVLAFLPVGYLDHGVEQLDYDVISTIAYFSIEANADGTLRRKTNTGDTHWGWRGWRSEQMDRIIERAHATGTRVVFSLERFAWSAGQARVAVALLRSEEARERLVREVVDEVVARGVDGVNVDFEPIPDGQKQNFVKFMRALRAALDDVEPGYQLTYAATGYVQNYDAAALGKPGGADAVYIMGYHYRGTWSQVSGSTAPLDGPGYELKETIEEYAKLTSRDEILVGLPYYGHEWSTASNKVHARTTSSGRDVLYAEAIEIGQRNGIRYDKTEQTAWTVWRSGAGWRQLYFDDARTLGIKWDYIKRQRLLGSGIWSVGFEQGRTELNEVLRARFVATP